MIYVKKIYFKLALRLQRGLPYRFLSKYCGKVLTNGIDKRLKELFLPKAKNLELLLNG